MDESLLTGIDHRHDQYNAEEKIGHEGPHHLPLHQTLGINDQIFNIQF